MSCRTETPDDLCVQCQRLGDDCDGSEAHMLRDEIIEIVIKNCKVISRHTGKTEIIVDDHEKLHKELDDAVNFPDDRYKVMCNGEVMDVKADLARKEGQ
jgi:hypothetical protein